MSREVGRGLGARPQPNTERGLFAVVLSYGGRGKRELYEGGKCGRKGVVSGWVKLL